VEYAKSGLLRRYKRGVENINLKILFLPRPPWEEGWRRLGDGRVYFRQYLQFNIKNMGITQILALCIVVVLIILALAIKPIRKAIGLLLVILGGLACMTVIGAIIGIPMIIVGGIFLFV
jgi:hypothetical protein